MEIAEDLKGKVKYVNNFPNQCSYLYLLPFAPNSPSVGFFNSQYCYFVENILAFDRSCCHKYLTWIYYFPSKIEMVE